MFQHHTFSRRLVYAAALVSLLWPSTAFSADPPDAAQPAVAQPTKQRGPTLGKHAASSSKGVVVAGGPEAVDAGIEILNAGGNAADAAASVIVALSVTDANQFCFGGEVPILAYSVERKVVEAYSGMGAAPRLATREHFTALGGIPKAGLAPAAIPSALDACLTLLDRAGTKSFAEIAAPTLRILDRGEHSWHPAFAKTLRRLIEAESGATDRKQGLRLAADYFYRGPIARELDAWMQENGGLIRYADLAGHVTRVEEPVSLSYRGRKVFKCGPWTQGPYLLQTLALLEGFDLENMPHNGPDAVHTIAEALKLGLADRDVFYGDPLYSPIPLDRLLAADYNEHRRGLIDPQTASLELRPGNPLGSVTQPSVASGKDAAAASDTTTCLVADERGNVVAATPSGWSGVLCEPLGVWLGTRLQSFDLNEGGPNCIEPGKRPRITLTPTIVLESDKPSLAISVAGGDHQDQVVLQVLVNSLDYRLSAAEAVSKPRFVTEHYIGSFGQTPPKLGHLTLGGAWDEATVAALKARGHDVKIEKGRPAAPILIQFDAQTGVAHAAGDPAHGRHAAGR